MPFVKPVFRLEKFTLLSHRPQMLKQLVENDFMMLKINMSSLIPYFKLLIFTFNELRIIIKNKLPLSFSLKSESVLTQVLKDGLGMSVEPG